MAITSFLMPALIGGLMLYGKSKASAAFRWIMSDEMSVLSMPVALLLTKVETGESLPEAPQGFRWKQVSVSFASSPFATPQQLIINVLEQWLNGSSIPGAAPQTPAINGFLTAQGAMAAGMHGFLTSQGVMAAGMHGFLDRESVAMSPAMGEVLDRSTYLYSPQTAPDFGGYATEEAMRASAHYPAHRGGGIGEGGDVLGQLGAELRSKGLLLAPIGKKGIKKGDYVLARNRALWIARSTPAWKTFGMRFQAQQLHPKAGAMGELSIDDAFIAYGLRRA